MRFRGVKQETEIREWHAVDRQDRSCGCVASEGNRQAGGEVIVRVENGQMIAPRAPGLGQRLDEAAVQRYRL